MTATNKKDAMYVAVQHPYAILPSFKKDETGMYHIINLDTGVVEMETSILPQAIAYMRSVARSLEEILANPKEGNDLMSEDDDTRLLN